jgi:sortase (surface protein transpeptidase)
MTGNNKKFYSFKVMKLLVMFCVSMLVFVAPVFALTPKEQKGVITLKAASIDYLSPSRFTPFSLIEAPESLAYWTALLPEQDRAGDLYIVMPTLGMISPVILVPEDSADYLAMQGGGEIDINKYLVDGVMHYPWTPLPNQEGNIVIFGHSNFYSAQPGRYKTIFADIMNMDAIAEDEIRLYWKNEHQRYDLYKYRIEKSYETAPTDVAILEPQGGKELTVFACTNGLAWRWILRAKQLADEEILVTSAMKVRVWGLLERFAKLSPQAQESIRVRLLTEIESVRGETVGVLLTTPLKMRRYLLRRLENSLLKA